MYSVYEDTVCDPFWGTGTTSLAAMVAGRNSIGYELDEAFAGVFGDRVGKMTDFSKNVVRQRLDDHRDFVRERIESGESFEYEAEQYDFPVTTKQEQSVRFYSVRDIETITGGYWAVHEAVEDREGAVEGKRETD